MTTSNNWYEDKRFRRFWSHYTAAMNWSRRHQAAYWRARSKAEEYENISMRQFFNNRHKSSTREQHASNPCYSYYDNYKHEEFSEEQNDSEIEMEITDDILSFLETSDRHREQLKAEKEALEGAAKEKYDTEKDLEAPPQQPGIRRSTEMRILYGSKAPMIQAMETAVQLSFNRNCDTYQPKYWPQLSLKL